MTSFKKIIVCGPGKSGKTSLIRSISGYPNYVENDSTGIQVWRMPKEIDHEVNQWIFWDHSGATLPQTTPFSYFLATHLALYVIDLNNSLSFVGMEEELNWLKTRMPNAIVKVVATKSDLLSPNEIDLMASILPLRPDFICSSITEGGTHQLWNFLLDTLRS